MAGFLAHMAGYDTPSEGVSPATILANLRRSQAQRQDDVVRAPLSGFEQLAKDAVALDTLAPIVLQPVSASKLTASAITMGSMVTTSYPDGNPKTAAGAKKPDLTTIPPSALLHLATAMMNGAGKYGFVNWRDASISARPYVAAALRHLLAYLDGEDFSADTTKAGAPVHHLAHVMACCAILLDAGELGKLNDNRSTVPGTAGEMIEHYNETRSLTPQAAQAASQAA